MKLVVPEAESSALFAELRAWPERTSSVVVAVEVSRAVRRTSPSARTIERLQQVLARLGLIGFDGGVRDRAAFLDPVGLRTLDAIHLATALGLGDELGGFFTYDERQAGVARDAGLAVLSPS